MAIRSLSKLSCSAIGFFFLSLTAFSQPVIHSFEQVENLQKTDERNILIFIHTDWCRFCIEMENTTFKSTEVVKLLDEKFWFISLNAEEEQKIVFSGTVFKYKPSGYGIGIHELAEQLGTIDNKLSFPTICMLNPEHEIVFQTGQFLTANNLLKVLNQNSIKGRED